LFAAEGERFSLVFSFSSAAAVDSGRKRKKERENNKKGFLRKKEKKKRQIREGKKEQLRPQTVVTGVHKLHDGVSFSSYLLQLKIKDLDLRTFLHLQSITSYIGHAEA
jgi:hypothetical protein